MSKHWVKQAIGNDTCRPKFNEMFVLDGWLYATDSHRLHRAKTRLSNSHRKDLPNIQSLFQEINAQGLKKWVALKFKSLKLIEKTEYKEEYYNRFGVFEDEKIIRPDIFKIDGHNYQAKYIMQSFAGHAEMEYLGGLENMIYLRSLDGRREAVIMCINNRRL